MVRHEPLKEILTEHRPLWDHPGVRASVRRNFSKVLDCRTEALGAEVFASSTEQKVVYHTCKSRACPSCGRRATTLWQREQWCALPEIPYAGITFTMPDVFWPIFRANRNLLRDLPVLAATVIQQWAVAEFGARLLITAVPHTFGGPLNFNSHVHTLVSAAGLHRTTNQWIANVAFDGDALMRNWRYAIVTYLRKALESRILKSSVRNTNLLAMFWEQSERQWQVKVTAGMSKKHFLSYAARYVRRPPIAQYRFVKNNLGEIQFRTKDHRLRREVLTRLSPAEFIDRLQDHVHDHYRHGIRHFGLLAPRSRRLMVVAVGALLGQTPRPKPPRLSWALSIRREFKVDPLTDSAGESMRWIARRPPILPLQ